MTVIYKFGFVIITLICLCDFCNALLLKRCFTCRSRGELGSCRDSFTINATQVATEEGVETVPCASGWCGKILETENPQKEEYGVATQRMCLQRGPSDNEDRCAYTKYNHRQVLMCFCRGDLCNSAISNSKSNFLILFLILNVTYFFITQ